MDTIMCNGFSKRKVGLEILLSILLITGCIRLWILQVTVQQRERSQYDAISSSRVMHDILVSSYMRAGSSYTAQLLGHREDSFYFYEPLWSLTRRLYIQNASTICSAYSDDCWNLTSGEGRQRLDSVVQLQRLDTIRQLQHQNRSVSDSADIRQVPLKILQDLYNCNCTYLHALLAFVNFIPRTAGPSWLSFRHCFRYYGDKETCVQLLPKVCQTAKRRIFKVLRLHVGAYNALLQANERLVVVHLYRDPRAVINSRIWTHWYTLSGMDLEQLRKNAKGLCSKMVQDYREGTELKRKYPDRFHFLFFEDLLEFPHFKAMMLYRLLNIKKDAADLGRVINFDTDSVAHAQGYLEQRAENYTSWWRQSLSWKQVKTVDEVCKEAYNILSYRTMENENSLRAISIPSHDTFPSIL